MRLSHTLFFLPFIVAAPAAGEHISRSEAPYLLCLDTLASGITKDKEGYCECAAKVFLSRPTGVDIFLKNYMHYYVGTGGNRVKAEQEMVRETNLDYNEVTGRVSVAMNEISIIVDGGLCE